MRMLCRAFTLYSERKISRLQNRYVPIQFRTVMFFASKTPKKYRINTKSTSKKHLTNAKKPRGAIFQNAADRLARDVGVEAPLQAAFSPK